jgi:hypothetical protein
VVALEVGTLHSLCTFRVIERLARLGYASIGVVYAIIGLLAVMAALGMGGATTGHEGAIAWLQHLPFGRLILAVILAGLIGYALWRLVSGVGDTDRRGSDAKGLAIRAGSIARGLVYAAFALEVFRLITDRSGSNGDQTRHWTARILDEPYGKWLVLLGGLIVIGAGVYQMSRAWRSKLGKRLHLGEMNASVERKVVAISRFGIAARAVVFFVVGVSLVRAALQHNADAARGSSRALDVLPDPMLVLVGLGLVAYGVYAVVNARYRTIRA